MSQVLPRCKTRKDTYTFDYPAAIEAAERQMEIFWLPTEPEVEKDLHCIKTDLTEAEYHGVITTLKLFTLYELVAGNEYWGGRFKRTFPRPDFQRMANAFSFMEINVHAPFYSRVDEILGLNTDEFYSSFVDDPVLKARMDFLDTCVKDPDDLFSVGAFSMVEGAILYSSFAFLKHFQAEGKNKIVNIDAGISFSVKDENLHSEGGAWAFRTLLKEERELGFTAKQEAMLIDRLVNAAEVIREHEHRINEMIFAKGPIKGYTQLQADNFVESRLDLGLQNLGIKPIYKPEYNPVAKWFYKSLGGDQAHDFFNKLGSSYNRDWKERKFTWKNDL